MNFVIIGGGISGLNSAYKLAKQFPHIKIQILEKSDRLGGRIKSEIVNDDLTIELGAGGFMSSHKRVIELVKELKLDDQVVPSLNDQIKPRSNGRALAITSDIDTNIGIIPKIYHIDKFESIFDTDFYSIIDNLTLRMENPVFRKMAMSYTLFDLVEKFFGWSTANSMVYQFGYRGDFWYQNSVQAVKMFTFDFNPTSAFYQFKKGMIQIIQQLALKVKEYHIEISLNTECVDIEKNESKYQIKLSNGQTINSDQIILAIPLNSLIKIPFLSKIHNKLNMIRPKALCRIYATFPLVDGKVWFDFLPSTITTKSTLCQVVPYDKSQGVMMIYSDDIYADFWGKCWVDGTLERELMFHLIKLFSDKEVPSPINIVVAYWNAATHLWRPSLDPVVKHHEMIQPIESENIYIVGEAYSLNQQWSEGALQSVESLMELIVDKFKDK